MIKDLSLFKLQPIHFPLLCNTQLSIIGQFLPTNLHHL